MSEDGFTYFQAKMELEGCSGIPDMKGNAPHAVTAHGVQEDAVSVVNEKSYVTVTRDGIVMGVQ